MKKIIFPKGGRYFMPVGALESSAEPGDYILTEEVKVEDLDNASEPGEKNKANKEATGKKELTYKHVGLEKRFKSGDTVYLTRTTVHDIIKGKVVEIREYDGKELPYIKTRYYGKIYGRPKFWFLSLKEAMSSLLDLIVEEYGHNYKALSDEISRFLEMQSDLIENKEEEINDN